jgi:hypothetical protein
VILFAHWTEAGAVELADGPAAHDKVLTAIPESFRGILDLCVCHPLPLVKAVREQRPDVVVKFTHLRAVPAYWLQLYRVVFSLLDRSAGSYTQALVNAVQALRAGPPR